MTSWRDTASPEVQADLDGLLEAVLPLAEQALAQRGELAVVADVWTMTGDAVRVELEHRDGPALLVLRPYRRARFTRRRTYGGLTTGPGEPRVWATRADDS